jgi:hypothetical protein
VCLGGANDAYEKYPSGRMSVAVSPSSLESYSLSSQNLLFPFFGPLDFIFSESSLNRFENEKLFLEIAFSRDGNEEEEEKEEEEEEEKGLNVNKWIMYGKCECAFKYANRTNGEFYNSDRTKRCLFGNEACDVFVAFHKRGRMFRRFPLLFCRSGSIAYV